MTKLPVGIGERTGETKTHEESAVETAGVLRGSGPAAAALPEPPRRHRTRSAGCHEHSAVVWGEARRGLAAQRPALRRPGKPLGSPLRTFRTTGVETSG